ncbi:MAG: hypothetical protein QM626_06560 [Microbacterium sp.]|uniref:hypothetical protein n=1 Tax=Microbacterium sp. TaxID=51671 RepID=UPI0039E6B954
MLGSRVARTWRGAAAGGVATLAASVSHSVADGRPAPWLDVVLALALAVPLCVALAGARLSWIRLTVAVAVSQFAFHGLLLVGVGEDAGADAVPMPGMAGHMDTGSLSAVVASAGTGTELHHDAGMWVAHAIAAVVTVLAIGHGERALRALLGLSGWELVARTLDPRPLPATAPLKTCCAEPRAPRPSVVLTARRRRGPPLAA